jgi:ribulose kinase
MVHRLTGRNVASLANVTTRWHYRTGAGGWPRSLLAALDLDDLLARWPADVVAPGERVGPLTAAAAQHLGLTTATQVVQGGIDAFVCMIGLGVAQPGQLALVTGSSHLQLAVTHHPVAARGLWGSYADTIYPGRHVIEGGQSSSGSMIAWLVRFIGTDADLAQLNREAAAIAPGSDGLVVLDHFQGNRTPYTDALSRGALVGLSLSHGRAHVFRAMMEGVACGTRTILDARAAAGVPVEAMVVGGGATRSPLWLQIHADVAGKPVQVTRLADASALGAGILAAVGAGEFPHLDAGIAAMVRIERVVEPDAANSARYTEILDRYNRLYPALKAWREAPAAARAG